MTALDHAMSLVKKWEGLRLTAYPDPASGGDPWTIGYGSTGPDVKPGVTWTQAQAEHRLSDDLTRFMVGVRAAVKHPATPAQLGAMTSLAYNIGLGAFRASALLRTFNEGDIKGAAAQFPRWNRAAGRVMTGLSNRRADEQRVFLSE